MKRTILTGSAAALFCIGLASPLLAAQSATISAANAPVPAKKPALVEGNVSAVAPAKKCLTDLRAFNSQTQKDGYWLGGSGYGYGYPMDGFGYGYGYPSAGNPANTTAGYQNARPGYEVRMLAVAANILARHGQQQACEDVLSTTRDIYKVYVADMHKRGGPMANTPVWWQRQVAAAKPVTDQNTAFRSDQLLGTNVSSPTDDTLGTVDDLVMDPQTGKIAYLVIGRGGVFGIDEKYVPVPWEAFKATPNGSLLVLDTTKDAMKAAPQVKDEEFSMPGQFDQESQKVDAYWKTHLSSKDAAATKG